LLKIPSGEHTAALVKEFYAGNRAVDATKLSQVAGRS